MNFQEAEARFRWIEGERAAGRMNEQAYRNELNALRVVDAWGRHWMPQERTGIWHMYDGRQWVPGTPVEPASPPPPPPAYQAPVQPQYQAPPQAYPPGYQQPAPVQPPYQAPVAPQAYAPGYQPVAPQPAQAQAGGSSCSRFLLYGVMFVVIWVIIAAVVFFVFARDQPEVLLGVAAAAVLSGVLMLYSLAGTWQGQVVEIKTVRETHTDSDGDVRHEDVTYAYVRQPNGKIRKERAMPNWKVGDRLEKRRGEAFVRVNN